jgi:NCAIR mutase (PurE)-related protein
VYGEGKTPEQVAAILDHLNTRGQPALATRVAPPMAEAVRDRLPDAVYEPVPRLLWRVPRGVEAVC